MDFCSPDILEKTNYRDGEQITAKFGYNKKGLSCDMPFKIQYSGAQWSDYLAGPSVKAHESMRFSQCQFVGSVANRRSPWLHRVSKAVGCQHFTFQQWAAAAFPWRCHSGTGFIVRWHFCSHVPRWPVV